MKNNAYVAVENQPTKRGSAETKPLSKITILVTVICWLTIFIEGYDLVVYGAVLPSLMDPSEWGLSATQAGAMGSYALLGMFIGSSVGGVLSDKFGRKLVLLASLVLLSIMMMLSAMALSPDSFAVFRFIAGLGIGGIVPAASALTTEYAPAKYRSLVYVLMYTGFAFGGVAAAVSGMLFIAPFGWRFLFWLGTIPILIVPIAMKYLPESIKFLQASNQQTKAQKLMEKHHLAEEVAGEEEVTGKSNSFVSIFSKKYLASTVLFSFIYILAFLLIYGMNTWLPKIMQQAGYPMNSSLAFLLIFNLAAIFGGIIAGAAADRIRPKKVISFTYFLAALSIALLSIKFNIVIMYLLIAVAGFGTTGTTFVLASYVMKHYNSQNRATAIGISSAIGRFGAVAGPILVGIILSMGVGFRFNFYLFAIIAIIASLVILFVPTNQSNQQS